MIRSKIGDGLFRKSFSDLQPGRAETALKRETKDLLNVNLTQGNVQSICAEDSFAF